MCKTENEICRTLFFFHKRKRGWSGVDCSRAMVGSETLPTTQHEACSAQGDETRSTCSSFVAVGPHVRWNVSMCRVFLRVASRCLVLLFVGSGFGSENMHSGMCIAIYIVKTRRGAGLEMDMAIVGVLGHFQCNCNTKNKLNPTCYCYLMKDFKAAPFAEQGTKYRILCPLPDYAFERRSLCPWLATIYCEVLTRRSWHLEW